MKINKRKIPIQFGCGRGLCEKCIHSGAIYVLKAYFLLILHFWRYTCEQNSYPEGPLLICIFFSPFAVLGTRV